MNQRQKDKKKLKRASGRLNMADLPEESFLEALDLNPQFKSRRTNTKSSQVLKDNLDLRNGRVVEIRSNYNSIVDISGEHFSCTLSGRMKQFSFSTKVLVAVGDRVEVDFSQAPVYRIENILPRVNSLSRFDEGKFQKEIVVAANIDQVVITVSCKMPDLKPGLIDRYLCMAEIYSFDPIVCITKLDLCEDRQSLDDILSYYRSIGCKVLLTSIESGEGLSSLKELLKDRESVFSGQSGAGKSSLINAIEPSLQLATAEVSSYSEKGKHTTSQAILIPWSFGGYLVDTPGIKTINLHQRQKELIPKVFPGFSRYYPNCYFRSCTHRHEDGCAVLEAVENDTIPFCRYESYLRVYDSL